MTSLPCTSIVMIVMILTHNSGVRSVLTLSIKSLILDLESSRYDFIAVSDPLSTSSKTLITSSVQMI